MAKTDNIPSVVARNLEIGICWFISRAVLVSFYEPTRIQTSEAGGSTLKEFVEDQVAFAPYKIALIHIQ